MVSGIVLLRKNAPLIDRSDLVRFTTETLLHNLTEGFIVVTVLLMLFLGNVRAALIVAIANRRSVGAIVSGVKQAGKARIELKGPGRVQGTKNCVSRGETVKLRVYSPPHSPVV